MSTIELTKKQFWFGVVLFYFFTCISFYFKAASQIGFIYMNVYQVFAFMMLALLHVCLGLIAVFFYLAFNKFRLIFSIFFISVISIAYILHVLFYAFTGPSF